MIYKSYLHFYRDVFQPYHDALNKAETLLGNAHVRTPTRDVILSSMCDHGREFRFCAERECRIQWRHRASKAEDPVRVEAVENAKRAYKKAHKEYWGLMLDKQFPTSDGTMSGDEILTALREKELYVDVCR